MTNQSTQILAHLHARRSGIDEGWTTLAELRQVSGYKGDKLSSIVAELPGVESRGGYEGGPFQVRIKAKAENI